MSDLLLVFFFLALGTCLHLQSIRGEKDTHKGEKETLRVIVFILILVYHTIFSSGIYG